MTCKLNTRLFRTKDGIPGRPIYHYLSQMLDDFPEEILHSSKELSITILFLTHLVDAAV